VRSSPLALGRRTASAHGAPSVIGVLIMIVVITSECTFVPTPLPETPTRVTLNMANPAAIHCVKRGYVYETRRGTDGQEFGACIFPDGTECDGWAYFRGECGPGAQGATPMPQSSPESIEELAPVPGEQQAYAWYGYVAARLPPRRAPAAAAFDGVLVLMPEGTGEVGLVGGNAEATAGIQALRDQPAPDKYAHFWGTLSCDAPDLGGYQLLVTRLRVDGPGPFFQPDPVEGWEGLILSAATGPRSGRDDRFVLRGDFAVQYGIDAGNRPQIAEQLASLRNADTVVRIWGQLNAGVPDWNGAQIQVTRLEVVGPAPD